VTKAEQDDKQQLQLDHNFGWKTAKLGNNEIGCCTTFIAVKRCREKATYFGMIVLLAAVCVMPHPVSIT
jgi:hypothetical protein